MMKLLNISNVQFISSRFIGHNRRLRLKRMRGKPVITSWKNAEAIEDINEVLSKPYEQKIPESTVKRIAESNPANHTLIDVGKFYTMPNEVRQHYFQLGGISREFNQQTQLFNETCIMIRKPALEIIDYLKRADYTKLPIKYVIHGDVSCGKRLTVLHVLHYAFLNNFIVLHLPNAMFMYKFGRKEANYSETRPGLVDLPLEGAVLLKHFQLQNGDAIKKLNLKTTKEYVWNQRESTPQGSPLMELVSHGINRVKYSCDCIDGLIYELKLAATSGQARVLFVIGGINSFYTGKTMIRLNEKYGTIPLQVSIVQSFLSVFQPDWCNGAVLSHVCEGNALPQFRGSSFPFFLLRREGFETIDPFIPIEVPRLSELEFHNMLDYYEDRRWLQKFGDRDELDCLTMRIAGDLMRYCASL